MSNKKIPEGWKKAKFGDVVNRVKNEEPDRSKWNTDKYIGGQHFPEGEVRVTDYGSIKEDEWVIGSAFKVKFKPGDVLYVTRNPRLRKGGMVDFEGICSDVTYVLRADENQLLQSLLPFIIQTEDFVKHACNNAHGSTNPFLNWKDIAKYEFYLPPLEEQKKISEVLWSIEENIRKQQFLLVKQKSYFKKLSKVLFTQHNNFVKIGDVTSRIQYGLSVELKKKGKYPILKMDNLSEGKLNLSGLRYCDIEEKDFNKFKIEKGDILFNRTNSIEHVGRTSLVDSNYDFVFASYLIRIKVLPEKILPYYLTQYIIRFNNDLKRFATLGVHQANINAKNLANYKVSLPPIEIQKSIIKVLHGLEKRKNSIEDNLISLKSLRNKLLNELLLGKLRLEEKK